MMALNDDEIRLNMRAVRHAIAQQELEGLTVSPETIADMESAARGEIDTDEVRRRIHERLKNRTGADLIAALQSSPHREIEIEPERYTTKTDLARIDRMNDSDIDYSDIPPLDDTFLNKPTVEWPPPKTPKRS